MNPADFRMMGNFAGWCGRFMDISELPIAFLYVIYISLYIWVMRIFTDLEVLSRYVAPLFAGAGSLYIIWGAIQKDMFVHFTILACIISVAGYLLMRGSVKSEKIARLNVYR